MLPGFPVSIRNCPMDSVEKRDNVRMIKKLDTEKSRKT